jgi:hypothetical protein
MPKITSTRQMAPAVSPTISAVCVPCLGEGEDESLRDGDGVPDIVEDGGAGKLVTVSPEFIESEPVPAMA